MDVDQLSDVLTALSHPSRRTIIRHLAGGPVRFTDVVKLFDVSLNSITKHLKLLERANLISRERRGREVLISFCPEPLQLVSRWVHEYERFWSERLDVFAGYFKEKRRIHRRKVP